MVELTKMATPNAGIRKSSASGANNVIKTKITNVNTKWVLGWTTF